MKKRWRDMSRSRRDARVEAFRLFILFFAAVIGVKLFVLQIIDHGFYQALASGQHEILRELIPERGDVFIHDYKDESLVPLATNQRLAFIYADPRKIIEPDETSESLGEIFGYDEEKIAILEKRLDQPNDPYEPIERQVSDEILDQIVALELPGIFYTRELSRLYPEQGAGGHLIGFVGSDENGNKAGRYGIEGYFDSLLAGTPGILRSERDLAGRLIAVAERSLEPAVDGADVVLTIDRTIQFKACSSLTATVAKHGADSGSIIILDPKTGKIYAMCAVPDFNPNNFSKIENINQFNNPIIFDSYEPGSVFKPVTMAASVDVDAVTPATHFTDVGSVMVDGWPKPLGNAEGKVYGDVDMTQVLEDSINTGMIFAMRAMGQQTFVDYVKRFGFGQKTGIELETEAPGNISSLEKSSEIYAATATFGQGITVTPLQIAMAYAAIANGGMLKKPQIIDEIRYSDGTVEKHSQQDVAQVIDEKTSRMLGAMLVSVIEHGHGKRAGVSGYYIAGKTGTAQVARTDGIGYSNDYTIGSFAGFGPVEDPKFAMVVRIDNPRDVVWAESTAAPLFGEMAQFLLQYFEIPPVRK
ncbi:penicillin-binding protein 2 [Candidatus Falkowbacteria bacterium]|nr:penicillin-binding protein 2 [Candidatus Falkowbacteria bacterium]